MTNIFRGPRPDLTPAQVVGVLVAGIPVIATLLRAFGLYDVGPDQQEALEKAVIWAGVVAGLLFASDAGLRAARNAADARRGAAPSAPGTPSSGTDETGGYESVDALPALVGPESGAVPDGPGDPR
jgi:hypothetical protein